MDNQTIGLNKPIIIGIVALIVVGGVVAWRFKPQKVETPSPEPIKTSQDVVDAVTTPEIEVGSNPVANKVPEVNPVDRANPFKDSYKNPFE